MITKDEAALKLAEAVAKYITRFPRGEQSDLRDALDAYRNAPEGRSVEVVVKFTKPNGDMFMVDAKNGQAVMFKGETRLRITVLSRPENEHPMPGGPY